MKTLDNLFPASYTDHILYIYFCSSSRNHSSASILPSDGARATRTRGRRFISLDDGNIKAAADEWVADADSARMDYGPIADWDVGRVTDMTSMFESATTFNSDLSKWQMSGVETLTRMFVGATNFKQDLGDWKFHDTVVGVADMLVNSGSEDRYVCESIYYIPERARGYGWICKPQRKPLSIVSSLLWSDV